MKTATDPRHLKRRQMVKALFAFSFRSKIKPKPLIKKICKYLTSIDNLIEASAAQFPIEKINKIDLAILRLSVYELVITRKEPEKVIIDEAVELGKEFGSENSPRFINGVLGNILKKPLQKNQWKNFHKVIKI